MKLKCINLSVVVYFFLGISSTTINGQKLWTLEDCIQYAFENNITIKRQELQTQIASNNLKQAYFNLLPDLGAGASHSLGQGRVADYTSFSYTSNVNSGNMGLRSTWVIFSGFQRINTIKVEQYQFLATKENLEKAKNDIALSIASAYLQILFDREFYEVTKNQVEISRQQVEKTRKLYEVGNIARGSLLEIEASYKAEEANLTNAKNKLDISYLTLAQILDLDTLRNFEIAVPEIPLPDTFAENPDSIYYQALMHMPQIKSAENMLASAKSQLAVARGGRLPTISVTGDYYTQYNANEKRMIDINNPTLTESYPIKDQLNDKLYKQVSINLSIPIFTRYQIQTQIANAKINKLDAEYTLRQSMQNLRKEIEQVYTDALGAFQNFKARKIALEAQEENFKYVQQKFEVGLITTIDYNVAKSNYIKAQSEFLQAKYQFVFNLKIIDFYKGKNIQL